MFKSHVSARAFIVPGLAAAIVAGLVTAASAEPKALKWGTGPVGGSGHKAMVVLADLLNREMPEYRISVMPYAGAVATMKGFALGELDGYYGSDVAFKEFAADAERFKGFKSQVKIQPVQSFWSYTLDVGIAIKASDMDTIKSWSNLSGKSVYTGPVAFDTRKHLENALKALGVKHHYKQVDLKTAGSQLESGSIKGMIIYAAGGETPATWIVEASLAVDWESLNPTADEVAKLKAAKFSTHQVPASGFHKKEVKNKNITLLPFYWGHDLGMNLSEAEMYKMLTIIEKHADELGKLDASYRQIANGKMAQFQKEALEVTAELVPIHPGLAKFLKERKQWDNDWDKYIAKAKM